MSADADPQFVAVVEDRSTAAAELLARVLERAGLPAAIAAERERHAAGGGGGFKVVVRPDIEAFDVGSPVVPAPALVEALVDWLHEHGCNDVALCATSDSSWFWAENRGVPALADLLGYAYVTAQGNPYDVVDLSEDLAAADFAPTGVLQGTPLARAWRDADFRICIARNKTDEREGYALCLAGLLGVLPLVDKNDHYRHRMQPGDAVCDLLRLAPVHFAIIDATVSAHGSGGTRAPLALATATMIASRSVLLADFVGALKMGLDPHVSPLAATAFRRLGLPPSYGVDGNLAAYPGWRNVDPLLRDSARQRDLLPAADRLLAPWLQTLNGELFPLKHTVDAKINPRASRFFENPDRDPTALRALVLVNQAIGALGRWREAWRVLYDKDAIQRIRAPLGLDLESFDAERYAAIRPELDQIDVLLAGTPAATDSLRWREVDGATLFAFERVLPIPFEVFVERVDVARTIQFMNDYIGGSLVPTARDAAGRVVRQAERNLYLPQPNYLALYGGKLIDVSKIEVCDYAEDRHRMYWKTVASENGSALHDDGVVTFERSGGSVRVRIVGRQQFVLPPFWRAVDLDLVPQFKAALVTHAYETFFARTCANFEALVEGREIRIGRAGHEPAHPFDGAPLPVEQLERLALKLVDKLQGPGEGLVPKAVAAPAAEHVDDDGFHHFPGTPAPATGNAAGAATGATPDVAAAIGEFLAGLMAASARDAENAIGGASTLVLR